MYYADKANVIFLSDYGDCLNIIKDVVITNSFKIEKQAIINIYNKHKQSTGGCPAGTFALIIKNRRI